MVDTKHSDNDNETLWEVSGAQAPGDTFTITLRSKSGRRGDGLYNCYLCAAEDGDGFTFEESSDEWGQYKATEK